MRLTDFFSSLMEVVRRKTYQSSKMDFLCDMVKKIHDTVTSKVTRWFCIRWAQCIFLQLTTYWLRKWVLIFLMELQDEASGRQPFGLTATSVQKLKKAKTCLDLERSSSLHFSIQGGTQDKTLGGAVLVLCSLYLYEFEKSVLRITRKFVGL